MTDATLQIETADGQRTVRLTDYFTGAAEEEAVEAAYRWIKALRHLDVDGEPLRSRFTFRGESLWWFTELYLHKTGVVRDLFEITAALEALLARERPVTLSVVTGDRLARGLASQIAHARGIRFEGEGGFGATRTRMLRLDLRARALTYSALASRMRPRRRSSPPVRPDIVAVVHRAFWRGDEADGTAESYIGPVLGALERRLSDERIRYVAVGPTSNFSARRWWHALRPRDTGHFQPAEAYAPLRALRASSRLWRQRYVLRRALWNSPAVKRHARVNGIDWWPVIREELSGVALLQWPWSARAMDEAGAVLDALKPRVALTYAEAGGWGRALIAECRRRRVASVGLQHGFIYRHWLNYLHEPDEMRPGANSGDLGFPRPDLTLVFDGYAARHLEEEGRFPSEAVRITGSPRLDGLVSAARSVDPVALEDTRRSAGARDGQALVLLVTKYREARQELDWLTGAIAQLPDVHLAIKTHPAETADVYAAVASGRANVRVLPAAAPLAPLLAAARAVITVNSTVALDAAVLGVPALVIGLPNNLSPFVDAHVMAGAHEGNIVTMLNRILYDEGFRQQLEAGRSVFLTRYGIDSDGRAATRAADAILALAAQPRNSQ